MLLIVNVQPLYRTSELLARQLLTWQLLVDHSYGDSTPNDCRTRSRRQALWPRTSTTPRTRRRLYDSRRPRSPADDFTTALHDSMTNEKTPSWQRRPRSSAGDFRQLTAMTRRRLKRWLWTRPQLLGLATPLVADNTGRFLYRSVQRSLLNTLVESPSAVTSKRRLIFTSADNISSKSTFFWSIPPIK